MNNRFPWIGTSWSVAIGITCFLRCADAVFSWHTRLVLFHGGDGHQRLQQRIWIQGDAVNTLLHEELGKGGVVARGLTAEADLAPRGLRRCDDTGDHRLDR